MGQPATGAPRPGGRDLASRLRWRALLLLLVTAALLLAGTAAVRWAAAHSGRDAALLNAAGRQRMVSQSLIAAALRLERSVAPADRRESRERFGDALARWSEGHTGVLDVGRAGRFGERFERESLAPARARLAPVRAELASAGAALLAATAPGAHAPQGEREAVARLLAALPPYLAGVDWLVGEVEAEVARRSRALAGLDTWLTGATLIALVLLGLLAFEPAARTLRRQMTALRGALDQARGARDRAEQSARVSRESEARFRALADNAHDIIIELDSRLRILYASPSHEEALGRSAEALVGEPAFSILHPDDEPAARRVLHTLFEERRPAGAEVRLRHADGSWRTIEARGKAFETDGGETRVVVVARDVTEERRAAEERARLEAQVREMQRLDSLAVLAGGVAHDFNNLLTAVLGNAQLALAEIPEGSPARPRLQRVVGAGRRAGELTTQLLTYAGRGSPQFRPVELSKLVEEMTDLLRVSVPDLVTLKCDLAGDLPPVNGDPTELRQLVMNLLLNAVEATGPRSGTVRLRTLRVTVDPAFRSQAQLGGSLPDGAYVGLEVADTGPGLDASALSRIFDPFYTTRREGRGLGLSVVLGILRTHRGAVRVLSEPGRGTRFQVVLPPANRVGAAEPVGSASGSVA